MSGGAAVVDLARAFEFVAIRHARQSRKGRHALPYVTHLAEVARRLAEATAGRDPVLVAAGLLHDVVEDGHAGSDEVAAAFGEEVRSVVDEVTDPPGMTEQARRQRQVDHAPRMSPRARMLKLADKASNLGEIIRDPPTDWDAGRKRAYFEWGKRVADGCRGANPVLERDFDEIYRKGMQRLADEN